LILGGTIMKKINIFNTDLNQIKKISALEVELEKTTTIEKELIELINLRVSYINGCAYCVNAHLNELKKQENIHRKIDFLNIWRESSLFTKREKNALDLAEKITFIHKNVISEGFLLRLLDTFTEDEYKDLLFIITTINTFNRLMIGSRNSFV